MAWAKLEAAPDKTKSLWRGDPDLQGGCCWTSLYSFVCGACMERCYKKAKAAPIVQRRGLLRVDSAYRTVSAEAAQVIAGFPLFDLIVAEVCFLFTVRGRLPGNRRKSRKRKLGYWQDT
ncbi:hypothetical protein WA026_019074 [Henosepilachna vigintioctopunctata]|uniref:Uncharacterized protein n=1 Tax=Henosepilachna vigintioctopunctata TaxID=420089 RepID=A0AAW1V990_9CUCU